MRSVPVGAIGQRGAGICTICLPEAVEQIDRDFRRQLFASCSGFTLFMQRCLD
jgi:hypothetical protein